MDEQEELINQKLRDYAIELKLIGQDEFTIDDLIMYNKVVWDNYTSLKHNFENAVETWAQSLAKNIYANDYVNLEELRKFSIGQLVEYLQGDY